MYILRNLGLTLALIGVASISTATAQEPCPGDCNEDGAVRVNELVTGVNINLGNADARSCPAVDVDRNGRVAVNELIQAVRSNLEGCSGGGATFADVQAILTARCALPGCHSGQFPSNNLNLEAGNSFDQLVGMDPFNANAAGMGILRVDPGDALNSYILIKVAGTPPFGLGSQMPLFADPLSESDVATIRDWINDGANP